MARRAHPLDHLGAADRRDSLCEASGGSALRIHPAEAGRRVNDLRRLATVLEQLLTVEVSPDPYDNFLPAMVQVGQADMRLTGEKRGLLAFSHHHGTRILTARAALDLLPA